MLTVAFAHSLTEALHRPGASSIAMLPSENGSLVFFVDRELLEKIPENAQAEKLTQVLRTRTSNRHLVVTRVEPILNSEEERQGYLAFARP